MKKYIFLLTLIITTAGAQAATTFTGSSVDTSATGGAIDSSYTFGNTNNTTLGGGNTNNTTFGGGNISNVQLGGGSSNAARLPDLPKPSQTISGFVVYIIELLNYVVIALLTGALLFFLYGVFTLMFVGGTNEESRSKGKKFMMWGIISLFVMVSVWGLVNVIKTSVFGTTTLIIPTFK